MKYSNTFRPSRLLGLIGWYSAKFNAFTSPFQQHSKPPNSCSFILCKGELIRISSIFREIQVVSGVAWLTVAGRDIILQHGEKASIISNKDVTLVSALSDVSLVLVA